MSRDPEAWGIQLRFQEAGGRERVPSQETLDALLDAMRADAPKPPGTNVVTALAGEASRVPGAVEVVTEDGAVRPISEETLPADLPSGYHRLVRRGEDSAARLILGPQRCHVPPELRAWGWAVQLYALRSHASWGMGDLADLARLMRRSRELGAGMTLVNPLHAVSPGVPQQPSPYYPGSRCWRNPLYIRVEDVPGAAGAGVALEELVIAGHALNERATIARDEVYRLKMEALELLWRGRERVADPGFENFVDAHGDLLEGYATFSTLVERWGRDPVMWPTELRRPGPASDRFRADNAGRVHFHMWLQWLLDRQLARASSEGQLIQDLAIGVDPMGADAWLWHDVFARDVTVGAPPDAFNSQGQNWGALAFDPWHLRAAEYEPYIKTIRFSLARGGGLRLDHVMGLWRLFWIPSGAPPNAGAYVRYPAADLLDILALESQRARAYVIGEDLGTVEPGVREEMAARAMLSYKLLWFEPGPPSNYPERALAAVTNHDLPTVAGLWSGEDVAAQRAMGLQPDEEAHASLRRRITELTGIDDDAEAGAVVRALYGLLAQAPSALIAASLEDALEIAERHNHPGTTHQWPNWSLALPPLEDIERHEGVRRLADTLSGSVDRDQP